MQRVSSCPGPKQPFGSGTLTSCTPLGTDAFVQRQLELKRVEHDHLLTGIPAIADLFFFPGQLPLAGFATGLHLPVCS